jgi:hypothetical protein
MVQKVMKEEASMVVSGRCGPFYGDWARHVRLPTFSISKYSSSLIFKLILIIYFILKIKVIKN